MNRFALVNTTSGMIVSFGYDSDISVIMAMEDADHELYTDVPDYVNAKEYYVDFTLGDYVLRPEVPAFTSTYDLTLLPTGTKIGVLDESNTMTVVEVLNEDLVLQGPQTYKIWIEPPFPYKPVYIPTFEVL